MLKRLLLFLFLISINLSCQYFEDCDGERYQFRVKKELGNGLCQYRADSIGDCLAWNDQVTITFIDSCDLYEISQVVWRDDLIKKYGKK